MCKWNKNKIEDKKGKNKTQHLNTKGSTHLRKIRKKKYYCIWYHTHTIWLEKSQISLLSIYNVNDTKVYRE